MLAYRARLPDLQFVLDKLLNLSAIAATLGEALRAADRFAEEVVAPPNPTDDSVVGPAVEFI